MRIAPTMADNRDAFNVKKLSVSLDPDIRQRLRELAYKHEVSASSIIEIALEQLFERGERKLAEVIRERGTLRRF